MTFLPANYSVPEPVGGYMKFKLGKNKFRILSHAITGYEYWNTSNKPVRQKEPFKEIPHDIKLKPDGTYSDIKHFWAFVVWNYAESAVQILEVTQSSIQRGLKIKIDNREGNAMSNDFIVTRSGEGFDTEYDIDVAEPSPVPTDAMVAYKAKKINLEALFEAKDPFSSTGSQSGEQSYSQPETFGKVASERVSDLEEMAPPMSEGDEPYIETPVTPQNVSGREKARAMANSIASGKRLPQSKIEPIKTEDVQEVFPGAEDVPF